MLTSRRSDFLKIWVVLRLSSNSLLFTSHNFYLRCSQQLAITRCNNVSDEFKTPCFYKMHFNVILTSMPKSTQWRVSFNCPTKVLCISNLRFRASRPAHMDLAELYHDVWESFIVFVLNIACLMMHSASVATATEF
jgi:hypothetical protein